jgi:hypothetical protein
MVQQITFVRVFSEITESLPHLGGSKKWK